ncbi:MULTISPECIES: substrate-binding domain-containing protein [unclassified Granulicatella]|uniref:substrate-binding domain-containing protein n=1 Tax=unclassified Granulicatella TaxID=2630493 RepID=UPI001072FA0C|nr:MULTISPECIES: substrate-binding domain-containing protein [unclassified Granulicatella]MBF0780971.1 extracellular solute-binding protein [Granulicatella sp. 19428wC4_WM01]TFU92743.1 extracellular solute-binding protein [Granulicatella sp. WM01]
MRKSFVKMLALVSIGGALAACGNNGSTSTSSSSSDTGKTTQQVVDLGEINVISREDGSGTRGAFIEIAGVTTKVDGKEKDNTTKTATIQNNTEGVVSAVTGDKTAIGYISLGSLGDNVKAVKIDGVQANAENVVNGTYKLQRPFNIAWQKDLSELGQDFITFIDSKQGQEIVTKSKYVSHVKDPKEYKASGKTGSLSVVGSTSVTPLMEKLVEGYKKLNPNVTVDITSNGSSAGMSAVMEKTADIGMASRELKEKEAAAVEHKAIALDGIAIIVNKENSTDTLTLEQVKRIYTGQLTEWSQLSK